MKKWLMGGLLVFVLLFSILWHLPAQWVAEQLVKVPLPQNAKTHLGIETLQGSWHSGSGTVYRRDNHFPQLKLHWQLPGFSALWGSPEIRLKVQDFYTPGQQLSAQLQIEGWQKQFKLQQFSARVSLSAVARWLMVVEADPNSALQMLSTSQGTLIWDSLQFELPFKELDYEIPWPQGLQSSGKILGFEMMEMVKIPKIIFTFSQPTQEASAPIHFTLKGGGENWQLSGQGQILVQQNREHMLHLSFHIEVNSQPDTPLPEWTALMMRQVTPTKAVLEQK